jgi:DNA-directed RNA polymerase specialized sigma24 family protein
MRWLPISWLGCIVHDFVATRRNYDRLVAGIASRRAIGGTAADAEDLSQEIWLSLWREWSKLKDLPFALGGIIRRRAHQVAHAAWVFSIKTKRDGASVPLEDSHSPVAPASQESAAMLEALLRDIDQLPDAQREALVAVTLGEGMQKLGDAEGVVWQTIQHRVQMARRTLHRKGH